MEVPISKGGSSDAFGTHTLAPPKRWVPVLSAGHPPAANPLAARLSLEPIYCGRHFWAGTRNILGGDLQFTNLKQEANPPVGEVGRTARIVGIACGFSSVQRGVPISAHLIESSRDSMTPQRTLQEFRAYVPLPKIYVEAP